jgi:hypothetical protein
LYERFFVTPTVLSVGRFLLLYTYQYHNMISQRACKRTPPPDTNTEYDQINNETNTLKLALKLKCYSCGITSSPLSHFQLKESTLIVILALPGIQTLISRSSW